MLTRRAKLQALLALEESETSSVTLIDSSSESEETSSNLQAATSTRTFQTNPKMSDADAATTAPLRRKLGRLLSKATRSQSSKR